MYAMNFSQVGANIQKYINLKGMTQQNLADALGISKQVMNKIIKGSKAINVSELARVSEVLGVSTDALLTVDDKPTLISGIAFMGAIRDPDTCEKVDLIRSAIDEIHMLEGLVND